MPVFYVAVNRFHSLGATRAQPELIGIVTAARTPEDAVAGTLLEEDIDVWDIDVELLSRDNQCWFMAPTQWMH